MNRILATLYNNAFVFIIPLFFFIAGCNQKQNKDNTTVSPTIEVVEGDWTKDQKETIFMISKSSAKANSNPKISQNAEKIAQKTLIKCIKDYPDYNQFSQTRRFWYNIYTSVSKDYLK